MSGIFGHWDDAGPSLGQLDLAACVSRLGPPASNQIYWTDRSIALGAATAHCADQADVLSHSSDGATCVFDGRLDNRDELIRTLDGRPQLRRGSGDAQLVLAAYREFGERFAQHVDGDFAIALYDSRVKRLVLARDRLGIRPLCYTRAGKRFLFASNAKAILACPGVRAAPDEAMLADFVLTFPSGDSVTRTFFDGIRSLPPAHFLVVTPDAVSLHRYFDFDTERRVRLAGWPDYVDAFDTLFSAAVRNRLRSASPVAVTVSGGLDSAYIFCVAHGLLREGKAPCPAVMGFNYAGPPGSPSDERDFVAAIET